MEKDLYANDHGSIDYFSDACPPTAGTGTFAGFADQREQQPLHGRYNEVKTFFVIVNIYTDSNPDSAITLVLQGLEMSRKLKWEKGISAFENGIGRLQSNNGENQEALKH